MTTQTKSYNIHLCPVTMAGESLIHKNDRVTIQVPGSTANLGPFFDKAGAAITEWKLEVTLEPVNGRDIYFQAESKIPVPEGRKRGHAGAVALEQYLQSIGIRRRGLRLTFRDISKNGFRSGGTGSSGAEAVGAVTAAAVLFGQLVSPRDIILASAKGEPEEHKDNVAPSVLGGIVFLSDVPNSPELVINRVSPPRNLGLAIGFSSHQKEGGTEAYRKVLDDPVVSKIFVRQVGRAVNGALSLRDRNVEDFLQLVLGDEFHEPRRADAGCYGKFSAEEFAKLKKELYEIHRIALAVSGAGPSMLFWFNKLQYRQGIPVEPKEFAEEWFNKRGISMRIEAVKIQARGAYSYAQQAYPQSVLLQSK